MGRESISIVCMSAHPVPVCPLRPPLHKLHKEEAYRRLIDSVQDYAIFLLDPQGYVATWNLGAQRIKGYSADEIIGRHLSLFYPQEALDAGWPDEELRQAAEIGRFEDEGWRVRKDGSRFWANVVITALRGDNGELLGFSKITRDLTERRAHEEQLRRSEENFRLLVEGARNHAMFMLDAEGVVLGWNAGAELLHGFKSYEIIGRSVAVLYAKEDAANGRLQADLAAAQEAGFLEVSGWRVRRDGERFWADVSLTALRDERGMMRGFAQITRDLSDQRRVQELETEGKRLNEFIAMLAHELRNPLAPIGNAVGILEKVGATPELQWCARLIGRQVTHLSRLVDDLLDVSRITSGKIQMRREPLELGAIVATAIESVRSTVNRFNHTLELTMPPDPVPVNGDSTRLTQMIVNLVTNAAKYTPNGGRIQVGLERQGSILQLRVVDNGIGMTKDLLDRAFDLFVQGERALDRSEGGLGIGLTLVKRIVQMHGGDVLASSDGPGMGTSMTVLLPAARHARGYPQGQGPRPVLGRTHRILVIDDNLDAAMSLATLLRLSGHLTVLAHDGLSALALAEADPPDAVLLDLELPGMSGYEVARRMREMGPLSGTRLIAMTGHGLADDKRASIEAGFDAHLLKPASVDDVLNAISRAASGVRSHS